MEQIIKELSKHLSKNAGFDFGYKTSSNFSDSHKLEDRDAGEVILENFISRFNLSEYTNESRAEITKDDNHFLQAYVSENEDGSYHMNILLMLPKNSNEYVDLFQIGKKFQLPGHTEEALSDSLEVLSNLLEALSDSKKEIKSKGVATYIPNISGRHLYIDLI